MPIAVSPHELELMAAAILPHRRDIPDGVRTSDLRGEFGKQMRLGACSVEHFIPRKQHFLEYRRLNAHHEVNGRPVGVGNWCCRIRLFADPNVSFGSFCHVRSNVLQQPNSIALSQNAH